MLLTLINLIIALLDDIIIGICSDYVLLHPDREAIWDHLAGAKGDLVYLKELLEEREKSKCNTQNSKMGS